MQQQCLCMELEMVEVEEVERDIELEREYKISIWLLCIISCWEQRGLLSTAQCSTVCSNGPYMKLSTLQ